MHLPSVEGAMLPAIICRNLECSWSAGQAGPRGWTRRLGLLAGASSQGRRWGTRRPAGSSWPCAGAGSDSEGCHPACPLGARGWGRGLGRG